MDQSLHDLYRWVCGSRANLFAYLDALPPGVYSHEVAGFPWGGSMRNLHVHVADCYVYWLAHVGLQQSRRDLCPAHHPDVASVRAAFAAVDTLVEQFLARCADRLDEPLRRIVPWHEGDLVVTPRWLLLHPITHEFHHKGQLVLIGRQLGYPPPETDLSLP